MNMFKYVFSAVVAVAIVGAVVAQDMKQSQVRNPRKFGAIWNAASDAPGAKNGATVTATDISSFVNSTVLTLADTPCVVTEQGAGTNAVGGVKIYDFPEGRILVLGVTVDSVIVGVDTNAIDAADGGDWSLGTAVPGIDGVLDGTAVDLCPATSADAIVSTNSSALAASAQFDGTTTAKDLYFNMLIDDADVSATHTNTIDGTVTIRWVNLGDY